MPPKSKAAKPKAKSAAVKPRIAANGYRLCDPLPKGEVLMDMTNKEWIIGTSIGSGGFGDIYTCRPKADRTEKYVMKVDNFDGPLYAEIQFYMRVAKEEQIQQFMTEQKHKFLGMPRYIASGIHDKSSDVSNKLNRESGAANSQVKSKKNEPTMKYRFLVIERFAHDLEQHINDKGLTAAEAYDIGLKMIGNFDFISLSFYDS